MTALYAAFAQAESESISGNIRWSYQKRIEREEFSTYSAPLGYDLVNGKLVINKDAAPAIYFIFHSYIGGTNPSELVRILNNANALNRKWNTYRINYILQNERYAGNARLQKTYTTDTFPRTVKKNRGERRMYLIYDCNPAIVSQEVFDKAQALRHSRKIIQTPTDRPFQKVLRCTCGSWCRSRCVHGTWYWACRRHDEDKTACPITQIPEVQIQQAFLRLYYNLKHQGSHILPDLITNLQSIRERKFLWSVDVIELNKQIAELTSQNQLLATLRESGCVDPDIFISKSNALAEQLRATKQAKSRILNQDGDDTIPCTQELITILSRGSETLHDFDGELFGQLVDKVVIESNTSLRFRLKNGLELRESIERTVR